MSKKISLFLLVIVAIILSSISSPLAGQSKPAKDKKLKKQSHSSTKHAANKTNTPFQPLRMRRAETVPGVSGNGGEPDKGPTAFEEENYANRAYPATEVPIEATVSSKKQFQDIDDESEQGQRGEKIHTAWKSLGPTVALYPAVLNRTGTPYVASGRITALAIEPKCRKEHCRLYVGAAGGGIWRTNDALSDKPNWKFISGGFATNAVGTITIDPTDPTGETIYVGTGEPNASVDSEAGMGIYKSTNGGDDWTLLSAAATVGANTFNNFPKGRSISEIKIDPTNRSTIYVSTTRGVRGYSSVPSGATTNPPPPVAPFGLYKSTDGGNTFSFIWDGNGTLRGVNAVELDPRNPAIIYAAAFQQGIWRNSPADGGVFKQVFVPHVPLDNSDQTSFALAIKSGHMRIYAGDGASGPAAKEPESQVWRNDNVDQPAAALVVGGTNQGGWKKLTSTTVSDPGFATYDYCTGQCWYDNRVYSPAGQPDTVFVMGSYAYTEAGGRSNARAVLRSTTAGDPDPGNNNRTFTDLTRDATSSSTPNGIHPDQHALAFVPGNPAIWFEGSDGGLMRSSGAYTDVSSQCASRGLSAASTLTCQRLLSAVPTVLTSLNTGLDTLQFQSLSINPFKPTRELLGGTQDNGTFLYEGSSVLWPQTIFGDGGQSGFNAANADIRFHTYFLPQVDINFHGTQTLGWNWISDPFFDPATGNAVENSSFYIPIIADPNVAKAGSIFAGLQGVWRTRDNGGSQALVDAHCSEFTGDFAVRCGDWVELGSPDGNANAASDLTSVALGTRGGGSVVAAITRAPSDTGTLWVATSRGRVFVSKNADNVSIVAGADGSSVTFTRIDSLAANSPGRFVSGIYVDPAKPNHAWISYSGYNMNTPAQPGHVFEVVYDPSAATAVWTDLDGGTGPMGDLPVTALVRDDPTGDLYAATDFGVLRLPAGRTAWQTAGSGLPQVEVPGLTISTSARVLYAATHGRGAYVLSLPEGHNSAAHESGGGNN